MVPVLVDRVGRKLGKLVVVLAVVSSGVIKEGAPLLLDLVEVLEIVHADDVLFNILVFSELGNLLQNLLLPGQLAFRVDDKRPCGGVVGLPRISFAAMLLQVQISLLEIVELLH